MKHCLTSPFYIGTLLSASITGAPFFGAKKRTFEGEGHA